VYADTLIMLKKDNTIVKKIASICKNEPAIAAAYIFGSYAKGSQKKSSDLDVALLLNETKLADFFTLDFLTVLEKKLACKADVVILNKAGEVMKFEVRRKGILVFERSKKDRKKFEIKGRKFYEDFLYLHKRYVKSVLYGNTHG